MKEITVIFSEYETMQSRIDFFNSIERPTQMTREMLFWIMHGGPVPELDSSTKLE